MTQELAILVWAAILGIVQVVIPPLAAMGKAGYFKWNAGPRDEPFDMGPVANRLNRAFANFMETFAFFAVIVIALAFANKTDAISVWGARIYLTARVVYIPLYAFGVRGIRSLAWIVSLVGIVMCLVTLLKG